MRTLRGRKAKKGSRWLAMTMTACFFVMMTMSGIMGCAADEEPVDKVSDLEFTIVPEEEIPEELAKLIREKKENEFKLSYSADGCLYIVAGFGKKDTGGYSIRVNEFYLTENAIVLDTDLLGPKQEEDVSQSPSYPYIVICTADRPESVVFR